MSEKKTVLIADDHELVQEGISRILQEHYEIVAQVTDGRQLVEVIGTVQPDFALVDISMPGMNGVEAIRRIHPAAPGTKIVVVTQHNDRQYMRAAFAAGAVAYVLKRSAASELLTALEEAAAGRCYVSSVLQESIDPQRLNSEPNPAQLFGGQLTPRQREVVQLVAEGLSAKQIAHRLTISTKTVEFHKAAVMQQLGLKSTAELIRFAVETGVVHS